MTLSPADPRAKAIEAMARAIHERRHSRGWRWEIVSDEQCRADAEAALAALEQEGLVLADTREADDFTVTGDEVDRCLDRAEKAEREAERLRALGDDAVHIRDPADGLRTLCGHHVPNARRIGDPVLDAMGECWTCQEKAEALSSVPVEEEGNRESDARSVVPCPSCGGTGCTKAPR